MAPPPWAHTHVGPEPATAKLSELELAEVSPKSTVSQDTPSSWCPGGYTAPAPLGEQMGEELVRLGCPQAASGKKNTPALANRGILSPTCLQPPCQCHGHGGEPEAQHAAKHGPGGPTSMPAFKNLHEDHVCYLAQSGCAPQLSSPTGRVLTRRLPWAGVHCPAFHCLWLLPMGKHRSQHRPRNDQPSAKPLPRWQPCRANAQRTARQRARSHGPCQLVCSH